LRHGQIAFAILEGNFFFLENRLGSRGCSKAAARFALSRLGLALSLGRRIHTYGVCAIQVEANVFALAILAALHRQPPLVLVRRAQVIVSVLLRGWHQRLRLAWEQLRREDLLLSHAADFAASVAEAGDIAAESRERVTFKSLRELRPYVEDVLLPN